jgi:hypothetical protein
MSICDYLYVSGLRVESGQAVVLLDGKRLRVVRNGKGASRTTLASENPPSDGEITLKDLQARLKASGAKTATVQVATPDGSFAATLDPARAMGRKGRTGDYAAALAGMDPASREIAARYQLRTLPYGEENASVAKARLSEVLRHIDITECTTFLPPQFGLFAPEAAVRDALRVAAPADALRFAAAAMTDDEFRSATDAAPLEALRYGLGRLIRASKERYVSTDRQMREILEGNPNYNYLSPQQRLAYDIERAAGRTADTFAALSAAGSALSLRQKLQVQRILQQSSLNEGTVPLLMHSMFDMLEQDPTDRHALAHLGCFSEMILPRMVREAPATPAALLAALATDARHEARSAAASHPATPAALLAALATDARHEVRVSTANNPATPAALLERLAEDKATRVRAAVASNPATPAALLEILAKDEDHLVRRDVASNPATPAALLERLAEHESHQVRLGLASNPATPVALLERLAEDEDRLARLDLASNPATPAALLEMLAEDKASRLRAAVASNPATPPALLERLAEYENHLVRRDVASNPATPAALLERLAEDKATRVRAAVASNPSTPPALLERLAEDAERWVLDDEYYRPRAIVASNPSAPAAVLERLAEHQNYRVRMGVASNPATPAALLERLAEDEYPYVVREVVRNPVTPLAVLEKIASLEDDNYTLEQIVSNPAASPELIEKIAEEKNEYARERARAAKRSRKRLSVDDLLAVAAHNRQGAMAYAMTRCETADKDEFFRRLPPL